MTPIDTSAEWYVRKGARTLGPFSSSELARFLLLGRLRNDDQVTRDGRVWEPVTQVPELIHEELLDTENARWTRDLLGIAPLVPAAQTRRSDRRSIDWWVFVTALIGGTGWLAVGWLVICRGGCS